MLYVYLYFINKNTLNILLLYQYIRILDLKKHNNIYSEDVKATMRKMTN